MDGHPPRKDLMGGAPWGSSGVLRDVELEADYRSDGSPAIAHKRAEHSALKPIDRINLRLVHHVLYCAT